MDQGDSIEFIVDQQYENEKGIFTVISIHRDEMVIRWESGEEIRTGIELQRNIQARRLWEKIEKEKAALAAKTGRKSDRSKAVKNFEGFKGTDFKNSASGTNWRGRSQLGSSVTRNLPSNRYQFNSWAFSNKPEMHWLDTSHHKRQSGEYTAKFFVRVDPGNLYSGFSIGQPKDDNDSDANWRALIEWLGIDDHEETLHSIALKNDLTIVEKQRPQSPLLTPIDGGWQAGKKSEETVEKLADFLKSLPADDKILLEFSKPMKKDEALDAGKAIVATFGELFTQLIPIYNGAWS